MVHTIKIAAFPLIFVIILVLSLVVRMRDITGPILDAHLFRQTQTATVARNFYKNGINILSSEIDIFGIGKEQWVLLEFPLYQGLVALLSTKIGYSDGLGRAVSIFFGLASSVILYTFTLKITKNKYLALIAMVFFLFFPLNIFYQRAFMIESTVVFLHITALYSWLLYSHEKTKTWLFLAVIYTALALIQKNVYALCLIPPIIAILYTQKKTLRNKKEWIFGLSISLLIFAIWQIYVNHVNTTNGNPFFTLGNESQLIWNFGTLKDRVDGSMWSYRLLNGVDSITKFTVIAFFVGLFSLIKERSKQSVVFLVWIGAGILYFLLFFRIQSHTYYMLPTLLPIAIIASYGIVYLARFINNNIPGKYGKLGSIAFALTYMSLFSYKGWKNSIPYFTINQNLKNDIDIMDKALKKEGPIIFVFPEYDWNSVYTYYLNRKGIVINKESITNENINMYKSQGYEYILMYGVKNSEEYLEKLTAYPEKKATEFKNESVHIIKI